MITRAVLVLGFMAIAAAASAQAGCVGVPEFVRELREVFSKFPPKPDSDRKADSLLASLADSNPRFLRDATSVAKRYALLNDDQRVCIVNEFLASPMNADRDVNFWYQHIAKRIPYTLQSPEFPRGFALHVDVGQGAADLGAKSETFSASARALASFTFGTEGHPTGGRWRGLMGVSTYYYHTDFQFYFNPRVEYRIRDVSLGNLTTIGNLKAIVDANFGETVIIGGGVGLELHFAGIQVLYQRQDKELNSHLHVGLFIRAFN